MKTLNRYIFREAFVPFLVAVGTITVVGVMSQAFRLSEKVFSYNLGVGTVVKVIVAASMPLLTFTIPAAVLLAILIAVARLSSDSEMIALRAAGISLYQLLPGVAALCFLAALATSAVTSYGAPWGMRAIDRTFFEVTKKKAAALLPEGAFRNNFFGFTIFVDKVSPDGLELDEVFLADERDPDRAFAVTARRGSVAADIPQGRLALRLRDATVDWMGRAAEAVQRAQFKELDLTLVAGLPTRPGSEPHRMYPSELREQIAAGGSGLHNVGRLRLVYQKHFAQPLSCFIFGLLGLALGISEPRSGRSRGVTTGVVLLIGYYLLVRGGEQTAERAVISPLVSAWFAPGLFALIAAYVFWARAREDAYIWSKLWSRVRGETR